MSCQLCTIFNDRWHSEMKLANLYFSDQNKLLFLHAALCGKTTLFYTGSLRFCPWWLIDLDVSNFEYIFVTVENKEFRESAFFGHCADLLAWSLVC